MPVRRTMSALVLTGLLVPLAVVPQVSKITDAQRIAIIQTLVAEVGITRHTLPPDKKGIVISPTGQVLNADHVAQSLIDHGPAAKIGDRVAITNIVFKGDSIVFTLNGGPHGTSWYDHLEVGMGTGTMAPVGRPSLGPSGAQLTLRFQHEVPELTPEQVKLDLDSVIDFDPPSRAEVMVQKLPPEVKAAIGQHQVLVGMNTDMVVAALGRTGNKIRETDPATGITHEDWIYGTPPARTVFVRVIGDHVVSVTTYLANNGGKIVDTTPDAALAAMEAREAAATAAAPPPTVSAEANSADQPPPTLRRPGDEPAPPAQQPNMIPEDTPAGAQSPGASTPGDSWPEGEPAPASEPNPTIPGAGGTPGGMIPPD